MACGRHAMTPSPDTLCCADGGHAGQRDAREMTVELTSITDADVAAVADLPARQPQRPDSLGSIMLGGANPYWP